MYRVIRQPFSFKTVASPNTRARLIRTFNSKFLLGFASRHYSEFASYVIYTSVWWRTRCYRMSWNTRSRILRNERTARLPPPSTLYCITLQASSDSRVFLERLFSGIDAKWTGLWPTPLNKVVLVEKAVFLSRSAQCLFCSNAYTIVSFWISKQNYLTSGVDGLPQAIPSLLHLKRQLKKILPLE